MTLLPQMMVCRRGADQSRHADALGPFPVGNLIRQPPGIFVIVALEHDRGAERPDTLDLHRIGALGSDDGHRDLPSCSAVGERLTEVAGAGAHRCAARIRSRSSLIWC